MYMYAARMFVMSIESDVLESYNFDDMIRDFGESKTPKRCLKENVLRIVAIHVHVGL